MPGLGGFSGLGGIIYTLAHLGFLWQDGSLIDDAHALAADVPSLIDTDRMLDVVSGSAGCIAALRVLDQIRPGDRLLELATLCGERLLRVQKQQDIGAAWETDAPSIRPLTGFSHGAAGIAWALLKLAAWSNDSRFRTAAESAIAYERSTFVPEESNWPDFRRRESGSEDNGSKRRFCAAWCHGAAGIALARMDSLPYLHDRQTHDEISAGLQKTVESGFGIDRCLCHGDFGNLDILTLAEQRLGQPWDQIRKRLTAEVLAKAAVEQSPPALGLMVGLAGIGYSLLRLSCPERVPSVLILEPPVRA
jgi:lantibiotic modifying enzyme